MKAAFSCTALPLVLLLTAQARAQDASSAPPAASSAAGQPNNPISNVNANAHYERQRQAAPAETAANPTTELQEVVITAQKRTEKLEQVPVAASVVGTAKLAQDNATDISDLNNLVPSVNLNGSFNGRVPLGIRGVSSESNEAAVGISSGVAILIDGVPVPSDSVSGNQLDDIERIEVLKGPQATLGGRTAAAGVINIVTRSPKDFYTGSLGATVTNDDEQRLDGFVTGPITDKLDFSVSGFGDHVQYPIKNIYSGKRSDDENQGVRAKLLYKPTNDLDITLTGRFNHNQSHGENFVYTYLTPGATLLGAPPLTQALELQGITPSQSNERYNSIASGIGQRVYDEDVSLNIDYRLGDYTLSSTTAYQFERLGIQQDLFNVDNYFFQVLTGGAAPAFYNYQQQKENIKQESEELKILSPADRALTYVAGVFLSDVRVVNIGNRPFVGAYINTEVTPDTTTYDIYGRATWKFTPILSLVAGARYNFDRISYSYNQLAFPGVEQYFSRSANTYSTVVGDVTLQAQLTPRAMVYATYSRGYSPAAYNTALSLASNDPLVPVKQEDIDNFEIGTKGTYLHRTLTVNIDAFDTIYHNFQVQTFANEAGEVAPPIVLVNADARTRGVELDTYYQPMATVDFNFNMAYVDAVFTSYKDAECYSGQTTGCNYITTSSGASTSEGTQNVTGATLPNSPKFKFNIGADKRFPLPGIGYDLVLSANYAYRTKAQFLPDQNPEAVQRAFGLLNFSATLKSQSGKYSLQFFANNLTDTHYLTDIEDYWSSVWGNTSTVIGQPARDSNRYFGLRASANF